ncbi:MAG: SHOCT domain-containing protein [Clostridia bacterium]|nr:SHOCT domain-containing protein [Clostridia bacterium]
MDELKKLKELYDMGALTQDEYDSKKALILKRI